MRVVFLGTPEFAVPSLQALARHHRVVAVLTQPDRPKGRGNKVVESPVKMAARALSLEIHQPERLRRPPNAELLASFQADLMVVVGYGQIIPQNIIDLAPHGILNVHASLLPKYRGAAPIQWAIANGETETGVTIMQIDAGLDTGDMLLKRSLAIGPDETAPDLSLRLAALGSDLLIEAISQIEAGTAVRQKQDDSQATLAPILKKEDGRIAWRLSATEIFNRLRGFTPWPGAYTDFRGSQLLVTRARPAGNSDLAPGVLRANKKQLFVGCGVTEGIAHNGLAGPDQTREVPLLSDAASGGLCASGRPALELLEVQPAGKGRMSAEAFINGYRPGENEAFGDNETSGVHA